LHHLWFSLNPEARPRFCSLLSRDVLAHGENQHVRVNGFEQNFVGASARVCPVTSPLSVTITTAVVIATVTEPSMSNIDFIGRRDYYPVKKERERHGVRASWVSVLAARCALLAAKRESVLSDARCSRLSVRTILSFSYSVSQRTVCFCRNSYRTARKGKVSHATLCGTTRKV
jgi:hypothetical protein